MSVALAMVAFQAGDPSAALEHALAAWAARPGPSLAEAIRRLSERAALKVPGALRGKGAVAVAAWLQAAQAPTAQQIPGLLATLLDASCAEASRRLLLLDQWPRDPRVDEWCVHALEVLPYQAPSSREFWRRHLRRLEDIADPTLLARLQAAEARLREHRSPIADWLRERLSRRLARLRIQLDLPEDREALPLVRLLRQAHRPEDRTLEALLAAVHADPEGDGARLVYADALMERGDLRGEFIALQVRHPDEPWARERAEELLQAHASSWLGALSPLLARYRFERGFLSRCRIHPLRRHLLPDLLDEPAFATVRALEGPLQLALRPRLLALRELTVSMPDEEGELWAELLSGAPRPIERLRYVPSAQSSAREIEALSRCEALQGLRVLEIARPELGIALAALEGPVAARLDALELEIDLFGWGAFFSALRRACIPQLTLAWRAGAARAVCALRRDPASGRRALEVSIGPSSPERRYALNLLAMLWDLQIRQARVRLLEAPAEPDLLRQLHERLRALGIPEVEIVGPEP